ncbi:FtsQ-type POTRA domain-containing protein [Desulfovibrio aminophilus]|uniref:cell division protein FtsQ/DivIB n=1 Tax=Desulfovibrio aminophilus TaxID=81425 RepID=UPI003395E704
MSTLAMRQGRLKIGAKHGNRFKKASRPAGSPSRLSSGVSLFAGLCRGAFCLTLLLGVLGALGVGLLYGYRYVTIHPYFSLREIQVTGNERLNYGEVLTLGDLALGQNCLDVNVAEVERALSQNPWVAQASVRRELPNRLFIQVQERAPVFWVQREGKLLYADASGTVIAPVEPGRFHSLPLLEVDKESAGDSRALATIVGMMQSRDLPFGLGQIAWIHLTSSGDAEFQLDTEGFTLRFPMRDWRSELSRIAAVWQDLRRRGELPGVASIAAVEGMVCVKRKTPQHSS